MFTGLVQSKARLLSRRENASGERWQFSCPLSSQLKEGDSIALNGACLTALSIQKADSTFEADISPETMKRTNFGDCRDSVELNAELPATPQSFLGGHWVQGHIDGVGELLEKEVSGDFHRLLVGIPENLEIYMIPKGSVCIDGVSLTINKVLPGKIELMIIPKTWRETTLGAAKAGQKLNIEADSFVKTIHHFWLQSEGQLKTQQGVAHVQ